MLPGSAATGSDVPAQRKLLRLTVAEDRRSATLTVPAGCKSVTLQRFVSSNEWQKVATRKVQRGKLTLKLPPAPRKTRWRVIGTFPVPEASRKFPARFYAGQNHFQPEKGSWGAGYFHASGRNVTDDVGSPPSVGDGEFAGGNKVEPVEADIWVTDGSLVFFFNQLRGLQVLDVSQPAQPVLLASQRIPAEGEDLYLLPGYDGGSNLLLITRHYTDAGEAYTRFSTLRYAEGRLAMLHRQEVPGTLVDSRMVGTRLILATETWVSTKGRLDFWEGESMTLLSEWVILPDQAPRAGATFPIAGASPVIAAGSSWLAVAVNPSRDWTVSEVSVFSIREDGIQRLTGQPVRSSGRIADKFKIQWKDHVLTTISERFMTADGTWAPTTVLENFRVWGPDVITPAVIVDPLLAQLELAAGESLYATRFAGNKVYIVTFFQTDPLWIVDLSDPKKPEVAGHLEVPGWSTYLEPIGNLVFSVGFESGTVAASLFDVSDPASPQLLRRVNLGPPGSFSEATWDEQALRVLPEAGLAMIPLNSYDDKTGRMVASVQLLDLDLQVRDLKLRGAIRHAFDARRSTLLGENTVISISQRALVAADITDRDQPEVRSEVSLAWPVDFVVDAGSHLLQIESGNAWQYGRATVRISPAGDTEAILGEFDLGEGTVQDAEVRNGILHVLRLSSGGGGFQPWIKMTGDDIGLERTLNLDLYDLSALPQWTRLGGCSAPIGDNQSIAGGGLCWPHDTRPCVMLVSGFWFRWYGRDFPGVLPISQRSAALTIVGNRMIMPYPWPEYFSDLPPQLLAFDVSTPAVPTAEKPVNLGSKETSLNDVVEASDGLVVAGSSHRRNWLSGKQFAADGALRSLLVVEVPETGAPRARVPIDLPGELIAVSELDRRGFLAFTRTFDGKGGSMVQAIASDGSDAFEVARLDAGGGAVAVSGRRVFVAGEQEISRNLLGNDGVFSAEMPLPVETPVHILRVTDGILLAASSNRLFAAAPDAAAMDEWEFRPWTLRVESVRSAADGDLLVPLGEHGALRLNR